ncbi:hypothetical protein CR513_47952, partial [Mucuna pruriens]
MLVFDYLYDWQGELIHHKTLNLVVMGWGIVVNSARSGRYSGGAVAVSDRTCVAAQFNVVAVAAAIAMERSGRYCLHEEEKSKNALLFKTLRLSRYPLSRYPSSGVGCSAPLRYLGLTTMTISLSECFLLNTKDQLGHFDSKVDQGKKKDQMKSNRLEEVVQVRWNPPG